MALKLWERVRIAVRNHLETQRAILENLRVVAKEQRDILAVLRLATEEMRTMRAMRAYGCELDTIIAADGRYSDPLCLMRYTANVYSQVGEDGILAEIYARIGTRDRIFVEIGVEDGRENTTQFLLERGWRGVWLEASEQHACDARALMRDHLDSGQLTIVHAAVTAENVNSLLDDAGVPASFDYLSIDIDQNTPFVWEALRRRSRAACIEYNGHLPSTLPIRVRYDPKRVWDGTMWFGGSLKAMELIGRNKEMALVGCDIMGVNAFFVSVEEATGRFREPFNAEAHYQRARADTLSAPRMPGDGREWQVDDEQNSRLLI